MENRHFEYKYITCYCDKRRTVQLGWKLYGYLNVIIVYPAVIMLTLWMTTVIFRHDSWIMLFFLVPVSLLAIGYISAYKDFYKMMKKACHSEECAKKVAIRGAPFDGIWSEYEILADDTEERANSKEAQ